MFTNNFTFSYGIKINFISIRKFFYLDIFFQLSYKNFYFYLQQFLFQALMRSQMDNLFYVYDEFQIILLKKFFPNELEVISVKYINKIDT